jgi:hypothetical protein
VENVHDEEVSKFFGINGGRARNEMSHFGQSIDDYPNSIVAIQDWQSYHEVY